MSEAVAVRLKVLDIGDKATGTTVLVDMDNQWKDNQPPSTLRPCGLSWEFSDPERMVWNSRPRRHYPR
jgi:hypothetical protein